MAALIAAVDGLDLDGGHGAGRDGANLGLGDGHLHLHRRDVENAHHGLRRHGSLAGTHHLAADDAADGGHEAAVGKVLLGHLEL